MSTNKAAIHFKIPKGTLNKKLQYKSIKKLQKVGPATILTQEEE